MCSYKTRHDRLPPPLITKISAILPLSVVTADKAYDDEYNHVLIREQLHAFSVIPARYENVPIWKTHGRYRKQMKCGDIPNCCTINETRMKLYFQS